MVTTTYIVFTVFFPSHLGNLLLWRVSMTIKNFLFAISPENLLKTLINLLVKG